jgi:ribosomal protein S12 methylthiotransferase
LDLAGALRTLVDRTSIPWYRLLYLYSAGVTARLLETIASESRLLPYLDMPIQHAADDMLRAMRRPERRDTIRSRVQLAREVIPDVAIRTTCIVGFPGETEDHVRALLDFLEEMRFDGVGCFAYSAQDGTRAALLADDVPESEKRERLERVTELQRGLAAERNEMRAGSEITVMVDSQDLENGACEARAWWQAHDIDGVVLLGGNAGPGAIATARVTGISSDYDLTADLLRVVDEPAPRGAASRRRGLPLMGASTGAYGR